MISTEWPWATPSSPAKLRTGTSIYSAEVIVLRLRAVPPSEYVRQRRPAQVGIARALGRKSRSTRFCSLVGLVLIERELKL